MINTKIQDKLSSASGFSVKKDGQLRPIDAIYTKIGNTLYVVWQKLKGWVFTMGRPISVSGRMIRLNGQK